MPTGIERQEGSPECAVDEATDESVIARVRTGETTLFEILMRRCNQRVFRAARAIVHSNDEAEEVMQEAYVRAYTHLAEFEGRARFSTWITRIAVREALSHTSRGRRFEHLDPSTDERRFIATQEGCDPEQSANDRELAGELDRAIDALPEDFRAVFVLRVLEEMSVAETAECLDVAEQIVKTRLFRARALLQEALLTRLGGATVAVYQFRRPRCDRLVASVLRRIAGDPTPS